MRDAVRAVAEALDYLEEHDRFNIVQFDHESEPFAASLLEPTKENLDEARKWLNGIYARGGTSIMAPLIQVISILEQSPLIPCIFLVTDGRVRDEQSITQAVAQQARRSRLFTVGIGPYCNGTFLQSLAKFGRGVHKHSLVTDKIYSTMRSLFQYAQLPLLTDITVDIEDVSSVEIYPFPIPDLYAAGPVIVAGKYSGKFPERVVISGKFPDQSYFTTTAMPQEGTFIPVHKVFMKQHLDDLVMRAWLSNDRQQRRDAVEASQQYNIPCPYTAMVAYETTPAKLQKMKHNQGKKKRSALIAGAAVGTVAVVGAALVGFGSIQATFAASSVAAAMGTLGGASNMVPGPSCCTCCGGCCESCSPCMEGVGNCCSNMCSALGNLCECLECVCQC